ncbi:hypothetical protein XELAEV_18027616mg [Xenopus laevis]|uniref:Uncharacterized protein n=1 Tax=Xenopus laevis TaxID=8355 RepID=A0A974CWP6_XENLA|nr:hypothetical protein XELAEV_18027616mg [Xenopus laevis]
MDALMKKRIWVPCLICKLFLLCSLLYVDDRSTLTNVQLHTTDPSNHPADQSIKPSTSVQQMSCLLCYWFREIIPIITQMNVSPGGNTCLNMCHCEHHRCCSI